MDLQKQFKAACSNNDCVSAHTLAAQMESKEIFHVLIFAVMQNQSNCVAAAYPYLSEDHRGDLLTFVVENRNLSMLRELLPHSDPYFQNSCALQMASAVQDQAIFDLLYPLSEPVQALKVMKKHSRSFEFKMLEDAVERSKTRTKLAHAVKGALPHHNTGRKI